MKNFSILIVILLLAASCKSKKSITNINNVKVISAKKIINNHYENVFNQQTISAKIKAKYKDNKTSVAIILKLRMEKDKVIWMSATKLGIPIAKVKITPTNVSYYEKLQKTYFKGDFSLLSKWLGTDLNFEEVQNLLLGQAVFNLKKEKYVSQINNNLYQLTPKKKNELFKLLFLINPTNFKLNKQEISHPNKQQLLSISYSNYNEINGEQFPKRINIRANDNNKITIINLEYKLVELNKKLTFPFSIPRGYKQIKLK